MASKDFKAKISESLNGKFSDINIDYNITERGASDNLSPVFRNTDPVIEEFYTGPDLSNDASKLFLIYGEALVSPPYIDAGTQTSGNDPSRILTAIRYITGEGPIEGVVQTDSESSQYENVYVRIPGEETQQPVVDQDTGRPGIGDIAMATILGAGLPILLKEAFDDPSTPKIDETDPVTGQKIASLERATQNIRLDELLDVDVKDVKGNFVLYFDGCANLWKAKHINQLLQDNNVLECVAPQGNIFEAMDNGEFLISPEEPLVPELITNAVGDVTCNIGGCDIECSLPFPVPEVPPTAEENWKPVPPEPVCSPYLDYICLPTKEETDEFIYKVDIDIANSSGIQFCFYAPGLWKEEEKCVTTTTGVPEHTPSVACIPGEEPVNETTETCTGEIRPGTGTFDIDLCLEIDCGDGTTIQILNLDSACGNQISVSGNTQEQFYFGTAVIRWEDIPFGNCLEVIRDQLFSPGNLARLFVRRKSSNAVNNVYFKGYNLIFDPTNTDADIEMYAPLEILITGGVEQQITPIPSAETGPDIMFPAEGRVYADDSFITGCNSASGGEYGIVYCCVPVVVPPVIPPASEVTEAIPPPDACTPENVCDDIIIRDAPEQPTIDFAVKPAAQVYKLGGDLSPVDLTDLTIDSGIPEDDFVWVNIKLEDRGKAIGTLKFITPPVGAEVIFAGDDTRSITIEGPAADVELSINQLSFVPDEASEGPAIWSALIKNACAECAIVATEINVPSASSKGIGACSRMEIIEDTGEGIVVTMDSNEGVFFGLFGTKEYTLTSQPIPFTTDANTTAQLVSDDINGHVTFKNSNYTAEDEEWIPLFVASTDANKINICAPLDGGDAFNGYGLGAIGGNVLSDMVGGVTSTEGGGILTGIWESINSDVVQQIGGQVLGALVASWAFPNQSSINVTIPADEEIPIVTFLIRGIKIMVPNSYDPINRVAGETYEQWVANGRQLVEAYTDNPAWCLYDYILNKRYGMGDDLVFSTEQLNFLQSDIYAASDWCDEEVNDGNGSVEPRVRLNTVIQDGSKMQILKNLCSNFFGNYTFADGNLRIKVDKPGEIKLLVNQASVDQFSYNHNSIRNFINKVEVSYSNKDTFYNEDVFIMEDNRGIDKFGEKLQQVHSFGTTNMSQAARYGNWIIETEKENWEFVQYNAGFDHYQIVAGDLVQVEDSLRDKDRLGGRVVSSTGTEITFDGMINITNGQTYKINVMLNDNTIFEDNVVSFLDITGTPITSGDAYSCIVASSAPTNIVPNALFILEDNAGKNVYRVIKKDETSDGQYNIYAQLYNVSKYDDLDKGYNVGA